MGELQSRTAEPAIDQSGFEAILATDVGSTTTKAILLERHSSGWRLAGREEAPTTVEAPYHDVTVGVRQAVGRLESASGRHMIADGEVVAPRRGAVGVDLYISTSSAGGGLQMVAAGLVKRYSAASAERAALGAGAIVSRTLEITDCRLAAEAIDLVRRLRPDVVLLCGGTDRGNVSGVVTLAEYLAVADPRPRVGQGRLPVVFAGNPEAREQVAHLLAGRFELSLVENVRPAVETEALEPARREIHRVFLEHVMSQAPGYDRLLRWSARRLVPTPRAVGTMMELFARDRGTDLLGLDIGGATTDVFSVFGGRFTRSVSANLGLSYSAGNVLEQAGLGSVLRWLPYAACPGDVQDSVYNKMVRPTTLPEDTEELILEHALAREALRLAVQHHLQFARPPAEARRRQFFSLRDRAAPEWRPRPATIIGSGGPLCHSPRRVQAAAMIIDALEPVDPVDLFVDSVFMLPHLGVLATALPEVAKEVFERDCLVRLGVVLPARLPAGAREGQPAAQVSLVVKGPADGGVSSFALRVGEVVRVPLPPGRTARVEIYPRGRCDFGRGPGRLQALDVAGGEVGLIFDARGRPVCPVAHAADAAGQRARVRGWYRALGAYPEDGGHDGKGEADERGPRGG